MKNEARLIFIIKMQQDIINDQRSIIAEKNLPDLPQDKYTRLKHFIEEAMKFLNNQLIHISEKSSEKKLWPERSDRNE